MSTPYQTLILSYPSLIRYYEMGDLSGTTAVDATGNENGAYSTGAQAPTLAQPGIPAGGDSVLFNGNTSVHTSYMLVSSFSIGGSAGFTMECWIFFTSGRPGQNSQIVGFSTSDGGGFSGLLAMTSGTTLTFSCNPGSGNVDSNGALSAGVWHHLVGTVTTSGSILLFVDGVQQTASATIGTPYNLANALPLYTGGGAVYAFDSTFEICNVAIYDVPLTPTQILNNYNTGIASPVTSYPAALLAGYG
jgi:concanavalin A-like lectin/glucanase superfamily protein